MTALADGVLTVTLNRPDKRNAIDRPMIDEILGQLERTELDQQVRVLALRGAGKDFCAGADLAELLASADASAREHVENAAHLGSVFVKMRQLSKIVVAVVHGRALAGGCGLATACDIVVASGDARFGYPEIQRGFVPAMVMAILARSVGEKVAFDLVATGRLLSAEEAASVGIVSRVIEPKRFTEAVNDFLEGLASSSLSALGLIKRQVYALDGLSFEESIRLGAEVNAAARATPDFREAVERFLDKTRS